jgi:hypothetical protein
MIFFQFFGKFLTDCAWSVADKYVIQLNWIEIRATLLGKDAFLQTGLRLPWFLLTLEVLFIRSVLQHQGRSMEGVRMLGSTSVGRVQRTEKWAAKWIRYGKKIDFLRSIIFQNAKLNKSKFNNCDFFYVRIPLKGGRRDYSLRASKTQIYNIV